MNLNCPYCGETIAYDLSLAGQSGRCSYCGNVLKMPAFEELPEEFQEELRQEHARREEKEKRKYLRKQERYLKRIEKEEKEKAADVPESDARWQDRLLGREKELAFPLIPGETIVDQLWIHHQLLFIFRRGITKVTLTNQRICYHATKVFSPLYWLLVALLPVLIFYYVYRLACNRSVSIPLEKVDSVEKDYRANWLVLVACLAGAGVFYFVASELGDWLARQPGPLGELASFLPWIVSLASGPVTLFLLLKTRIMGIEVRSSNNRFRLGLGAGYEGISPPRCDRFIQKISAEIERTRKKAAEPPPS